MKRCSECGSHNADHGMVCVVCGVPLRADAQQGEGAGYTGDTDQIPPQPSQSPEQILGEASDVLAEGNGEEAVRLCRRALALEPGLVEAYSLLGMAHEEAGDPRAALEAYEEVLRLEPSRAAERQKVSLLRLQLMRHDYPAEEDEPAAQPIWLKHAPIIFAAAATLLAFVILTLVFTSAQRARRAAEMNDKYAFYVEAGNAAMADGQYAKAITHFQSALQLKPDDITAQQRLANAQEWLALGETTTPQLPKYLGQNPNAPNPFKGAVIGPTTPAPDAVDADAAGSLPPPTGMAATPPRSVTDPVWKNSRTGPAPTVSSTTPSGTDFVPATPKQGSVGGEQASRGPINPRNTPKTVAPSEFAPAETTVAQVPDQPPAEGNIRVWTEGRTAPRQSTASAAPTGHAQQANPDQLRSHARSLSQQGRRDEAAVAYDKAIGAYRQQAAQNPQLKAATEASIGACEAERDRLRGNQ
ncbi:MAG TPA: hypothetical protein DGT21_04360 [Armatimonadetes bacterium]|nr:hypothetical protein [Armatimonadota bacterium]